MRSPSRSVRRLVLVAAAPVSLAAQPPSIAIPPNLTIPNYERVPLGAREGIEGGAFVARTDDASAAWYNPAGLARSAGTAINASANAYEWTRMEIEGLGATAGRSRLSAIGTLVSAVIGEPVLRGDRWRLGLSIARPVNWRPSRLDAGVDAQTSEGLARVGYGAGVDFSSLVAGASVGWTPRGRTGRLRVGLGASLSATGLAQNQTLSARFVDADEARVADRSFITEGSVLHALVIGGVQWDASSRVTLGARVVSPGIRLTGNTILEYKDDRTSGTSLRDLTFRDTEARFDYELPLEIDAGVALRFSRGAIEVDVRHHVEASAYPMFRSDSLGTFIAVAGSGAPTVTTVPFVETTNAARAVTNVAAGGNYALGGGMRLHLGVTTDASPVSDQEASIFRAVDLVHVTGGASFTWGRVSGSVGVGYASGDGARRRLGDIDGADAETSFNVRMVNVLYALTVGF